MAQFLPPAPSGIPPGHSFWNDWYEKLRSLVNNTVNIAWAAITGTPTTLVGYGITDAAPISHVGSGSVSAHPDATTSVSGFITALDKLKLDGAEVQSNRNANGGYAGLDSVQRVQRGVDTTDDLIVVTTTKGVVLRSPDGNYWRGTISNLGVVTWTNLGLTKP